MEVFIDQREPDSITTQRVPGVVVKIDMLPVGDAMVFTEDGAVVIERKAPEDLLHSIEDGRLFVQASNMVNFSRWSYLVITGEIVPTSKGSSLVGGVEYSWNYRSIQGALLTLQEIGVHVVYCDGNYDFLDTVKWLVERSRGNVRVPPARESTLFDPAEAILMALPGIGTKRAVEIRQKVPCVGIALQMLTDTEDKKTRLAKGVGPKTIQGIVDAIGGRLFFEPNDEHRSLV